MAAHAFPFSNKNTLLGAVSIIDRDVSYNTSLYSLCHCAENTAEVLKHLGLYWNIVWFHRHLAKCSKNQKKKKTDDE